MATAKHYLNFPQQLHIPFVGYEAQCKANARTANTTNSTNSVYIVGDEVRKVIVNYMESLHTTHFSSHHNPVRSKPNIVHLM